MNSPKHLSHKPIISVNDYDKIDALYADKTDVKALSIGRAQYDSDQISLKVWRHTDEKWSRQSEELPIHRNLDLSILFLAALSTDITAHYPQSNLREVIDNESEVQIIKEYYEENRKFIEPRLKELKRLLNEII
ncbi:MAG TPA: DUF6530 family protein [Bacteroidales bacterium]|jgi:hypothetical protein|nr:DUF6530 family protein [Bacteroidales bacterium]